METAKQPGWPFSNPGQSCSPSQHPPRSCTPASRGFKAHPSSEWHRGSVLAEGTHQRLHQTLLPREIQLDFYPDTLPLCNSYLLLTGAPHQNLFGTTQAGVPSPGAEELSVAAVYSWECASLLQSTRASGQPSLDCFTELGTLSRALCSVSPTRWPSKTGLGVRHPKPLALQSDWLPSCVVSIKSR